MSDVGAVVLTLGEPSTARALGSLREQSLPLAETVVVDGIAPFHAALNAGAQRITTPFFIQVDADFVLDRDCAETLRAAIGDSDAITVGSLRDPLMGVVAGVKLFRTSCFRQVCLRDTIAPEIDFVGALARIGWGTRYVLKHGRGSTGHTFGEHRLACTLDEVYGTYYLLGARYAQLDDAVGLLWRLGALRRSRHAMATTARVAIGHGVFERGSRDVPKPAPAREHERFLRSLVGASAGTTPTGRCTPDISLPTEELLHRYIELGRSLRTTSSTAFSDWLNGLAHSSAPDSWVAEVGLAHGALDGSPDDSSSTLSATIERMRAPELSSLFCSRS